MCQIREDQQFLNQNLTKLLCVGSKISRTRLSMIQMSRKIMDFLRELPVGAKYFNLNAFPPLCCLRTAPHTKKRGLGY